MLQCFDKHSSEFFWVDLSAQGLDARHESCYVMALRSGIFLKRRRIPRAGWCWSCRCALRGHATQRGRPRASRFPRGPPRDWYGRTGSRIENVWPNRRMIHCKHRHVNTGRVSTPRPRVDLPLGRSRALVLSWWNEEHLVLLGVRFLTSINNIWLLGPKWDFVRNPGIQRIKIRPAATVPRGAQRTDLHGGGSARARSRLDLACGGATLVVFPAWSPLGRSFLSFPRVFRFRECL